MLIFIRKIISESKIELALKFVDSLANKNGGLSINSIFQLAEIRWYLLKLYKHCLGNCDTFIVTVLDQNCSPKNQIYYDYLLLRKEILSLQLEIDSKKITDKDNLNVHTLSLLDATICELKNRENDIEASERSFQAALLAKDTKLNKGRNKKLKDQKVKDEYQNYKKNQSNSTNENNSIEKLLEKANQLLSQGNYESAIDLYQLLLDSHSDETSVYYLKINMGLGNAHKKLSNKEIGADKKYLLKEALNYFRHVIEAIDNAPPISNNESLTLEHKTLHDMAKNLSAKIEATAAKIATLIPQDKTNPLIIKKEIPLPESFNKIRKLLEQQGYILIIVGGYIRDFLLNEHSFDIDTLVFPATLPAPEATLHNILGSVQTLFPDAELRSKNFPNIYIEEDSTIIELSISKEIYFFQKEKKFSEIQMQILYRDGKNRDTTENAIYYDPRTHELIDFFGGIKDIEEDFELHTIQPPELSFTEDPARVFRMIRSIVYRTMKHPTLHYSALINIALQNHARNLRTLNKDKCFSEIHKTIFGGRALATWQLATNLGIENDLFLLPSEPQNRFKHSILVKLVLSGLDDRINSRAKFYSEALIFAALLWGVFQERLENILHSNQAGNIANKTQQLVGATLYNNDLIFRIPAQLGKKISLLWLLYLSYRKIVPINDLVYYQQDFRMMVVFSRLITHSLCLAPEEKVTALLKSTRQGFFTYRNTEMIAKELIKENKLILTKENRTFYIAFEDSSQILASRDKQTLLKNLQKNIQSTLGKYPITYEVGDNELLIFTKSVLKHQSIVSLMDFLFTEPSDNLERDYKI